MYNSAVDLTVKNSPLHEVKRTIWLNDQDYWKLIRYKEKTKQTKICAIRCP